MNVCYTFPAMPAKPVKSPRRRLSGEQRRERILLAGMRVFAERGYQEASMVEIARTAGITAAVIYDHFPSKAALQVELLERQTAELLAFVAAALASAPEGAYEQLRAGVDAFFRFVEEHSFAWRMLFRDPPSDPEVAAAYRRLSGQATEGIAAFITAGAGGALADYPDPAQAAEMFAQLVRMSQNGLAAWWYEHKEVSREVIVERMLEFCWVGLQRVAGGKRLSG